MKCYKVSTSVGAHYVYGVSCGWFACQSAQQELGEDVEIYDAIELDDYEENDP